MLFKFLVRTCVIDDISFVTPSIDSVRPVERRRELLTWLQAAHVKQDKWKTASRALMTSSLDPSGRQHRLHLFKPNNLPRFSFIRQSIVIKHANHIFPNFSEFFRIFL